MRRHWVFKGLGFALLAALFVAAAGAVVMLLWNWLLPSITGWRAIGFWEATGLLILARILVGGLRGRGHWHRHHHGWHGRWAGMTPEEREKFREGMKARCGWRHHPHHGEESKTPASSAS